MPQEALPIPHNPVLQSTTNFRREFRDLLHRPMSGSLTLSAAANYVEGQTIVGATPVKVPVFEGVLSLNLPPGSYWLRGVLWGEDEIQLKVEETFVIEEAS